MVFVQSTFSIERVEYEVGTPQIGWMTYDKSFASTIIATGPGFDNLWHGNRVRFLSTAGYWQYFKRDWPTLCWQVIVSICFYGP